MDINNLPQTLTKEQISQLRELLKANKSVVRSSNVSRYQKTAKGKAACARAASKYYQKKKKEGLEKKLKEKIEKNRIELLALNEKLANL